MGAENEPFLTKKNLYRITTGAITFAIISAVLLNFWSTPEVQCILQDPTPLDGTTTRYENGTCETYKINTTLPNASGGPAPYPFELLAMVAGFLRLTGLVVKLAGRDSDQ